MNFLTEKDDIDLWGDETIWSTDSYGEAGGGVNSRVNNKTGFNKGVQTVLIVNCNQISPCAYMHRHKLPSKPPVWTVMGNIEVENIMKNIKPIIKGEGRYIKNIQKVSTFYLQQLLQRGKEYRLAWARRIWC